ncbi:MAG: DMT family transporter [Patescibacteria group bacterium]|nr:DMT family transporter [Patescibacteria group bacterium]
MNLKSNPSKSVFLALIFASIIWGATGPVMKLTLETIPIFSLGFIRFGIAALILLPFVYKKLSIKKEDWPLLVLSALFGVTFNIAFFFWGLTMTSGLNSGIIVASTPILTLIFAAVFLGEKISKNMILGCIVGIIGIAIIIGKDILKNGVTLSPYGDLLILAAVVVFIIYEMISKNLFKRYSPVTITFYSFAIGSITFLPTAFYEYSINPNWINNLSLPSYLGIASGIFLSSLAAYILWQWGLSKSSESRAGFFFYLDPVSSTIASVILLSEKITWPFILGSIFIFLGLFIAEHRYPYSRTAPIKNSLNNILRSAII